MNIPQLVPARHTFKEHTGELELEIDAPNLSQAFAEAARALCAVMAGDAPLGPLSRAETVTLRATDLESLLVAWLNELVYLSETRALVYPQIDVEVSPECALYATVRGARPEHLRTPVKAATMHRLHIHHDSRGVRARVVLDV